MWSTFSAVLPPSILPGTMALVISSSMIALVGFHLICLFKLGRISIVGNKSSWLLSNKQLNFIYLRNG